jgi:hypothetical protein
MLPDPVANTAMPSGEPTFTHLAPQLAGIMTAFFPAPVEVRAILLDGTRAEDRLLSGKSL